MTERRQLGAILLESGRITQEDVARVLEHQRTHGGFFGQALVSLGVVSREELDWALANHFDLPFIFPNADAVDRDAAHMVAADWALAHLAVPIVRAGRSLTVVVAEPLRRDVVDDLRARTGCEIEMALASAARIRELIHALYDSAEAQRTDDSLPVTFAELATDALEHGAERFGVSVRGTHAIGWWRTRAHSYRAPLAEGWRESLTALVSPSPMEQAAGARVEFTALLQRQGGAAVRLEAQALAGDGGVELLFRPELQLEPSPMSGGVTLPPSLVTELRLLARGGRARVGVGAPRAETARALLPLLPSLALGEHARAAHINEAGTAEGAYTLPAERDDGFADTVAACEFDAVTIDLPVQGYPVRRLLDAAPIAFMILDEPEERAAPGEWGINWILTIFGQPGSYAWDLRALHG